jgi:HsdM N-terminal domain
MTDRTAARTNEAPALVRRPQTPAAPLTLSELEQHLWGAANILRGPIDQADFKSYIFPLLFFKRICDVYDEEFADALEESGGDLDFAAYAENHRFQLPAGAHWNDVREKPENVGVALQNAMRAIEMANPDTLYGIFGDTSYSRPRAVPLSSRTLDPRRPRCKGALGADGGIARGTSLKESAGSEAGEQQPQRRPFARNVRGQTARGCRAKGARNVRLARPARAEAEKSESESRGERDLCERPRGSQTGSRTAPALRLREPCHSDPGGSRRALRPGGVRRAAVGDEFCSCRCAKLEHGVTWGINKG